VYIGETPLTVKIIALLEVAASAFSTAIVFISLSIIGEVTGLIIVSPLAVSIIIAPGILWAILRGVPWAWSAEFILSIMRLVMGFLLDSWILTFIAIVTIALLITGESRRYYKKYEKIVKEATEHSEKNI